MKRNEITTIDQLASGDRFYIQNDKTKTVYQKINRKAKKTDYQTYRFWAIKADVADRYSKANWKHAPHYMANMVKAIKATTQLVFLRSTGIKIESNE